MKRTLLYIIVGTLIVGTLFYFLGELGLLSGLLGVFGFGSNAAITKLKKDAAEYDKKIEEKTKQLKEIDKEKERLKKEGVKDLSPEEESDYWKKQ